MLRPYRRPCQYGLDRRAQGRFEFARKRPFRQPHREPRLLGGPRELDDPGVGSLNDLHDRP
jgi:hypothetical protein